MDIAFFVPFNNTQPDLQNGTNIIKDEMMPMLLEHKTLLCNTSCYIPSGSSNDLLKFIPGLVFSDHIDHIGWLSESLKIYCTASLL